MAKLIYSLIMSLDGYVEDEHGRFGWGAPHDEEVHAYIDQLASSVGTYLYGRRMYDGKRFFPDGVRLSLELIDERRFRSGVVVLRYAAAPR